MPPKFLESGFDTTTGTALYGPTLPGDPAQDFISLLNDFTQNYDFTKIDTDAAMNLVNSLGQHASKKMFEKGSTLVNTGLDYVTLRSGATGQWYATAASLVSEKILEWAEKQFTSYMGWEDLDSYKRGDWVVIDFGMVPTQLASHPDDVDRRRRLPGSTFEQALTRTQEHEAIYKGGDHGRGSSLHIGLASGQVQNSTAGTWVEALDVQTGENQYFAAEKVRKLAPQFAGELNSDPRLSKIRTLFSEPHTPVPDQLGVSFNTRVGDQVVFLGDLWEIVSGAEEGKIRLLGNGEMVDVPLRDSRLQPAYNSTSYKPMPDNALMGGESGGFVTQGGYNAGDYVWVQGDSDTWFLNCLHSISGERMYVWDATTGEDGHCDMSAVRPVAKGFPRSGEWGQFIDAVMERDSTRAREIAPGKRHPEDCRATRDEKSKFGWIPTQTMTKLRDRNGPESLL